MDGNRQMDFERSGAYTHPNYSMDANRQAGYASESDRHRQQPFVPMQRSFDVTGQVSFDTQRQPPHHPPYQQQGQYERDIGRHASYGYQKDYGHAYDYPFDPFQSMGRGCTSHHPSRACEQDPFESINRQLGQPPCPSSTPPPPTVFHGHHAQLGPVYRSHPPSHGQQQYGAIVG